MVKIYRILSIFFLLISPLLIIYRILKKKESNSRFLERYGFNSIKRKKGNLIWFHCSSVGELISIVPIIEKLERNSKVNQILVTTTTLSSSKIFKKLNFKKTVHQFFPIDNGLVINKFINYWSPSAFFLCESEVWPNLIEKINKYKIKLVLINGRITLKSFRRWKKLNSFATNIFEKFDLCFAQNIETQKRLKLLGAKKIINLGNLKFATSKKIIHNYLESKISNFFKKKKNFDYSCKYTF